MAAIGEIHASRPTAAAYDDDGWPADAADTDAADAAAGSASPTGCPGRPGAGRVVAADRRIAVHQKLSESKKPVIVAGWSRAGNVNEDCENGCMGRQSRKAR